MFTEAPSSRPAMERNARATMMQSVGRRHVGDFNARFRRTGNLREDRHASQKRAPGDERYPRMVEIILGRPAPCRPRGRPWLTGARVEI
jgi:hypothetical protein